MEAEIKNNDKPKFIIKTENVCIDGSQIKYMFTNDLTKKKKVTPQIKFVFYNEHTFTMNYNGAGGLEQRNKEFEELLAQLSGIINGTLARFGIDADTSIDPDSLIGKLSVNWDGMKIYEEK